MHISISGNLGSGKSTICKYLNSKYGIKVYSTGEVQRELAREKNMSTLELNLLMEKNPYYDYLIDDEVAKISKEQEQVDIIFDSRMAWHFAKNSFKVFVMVNPSIAAQRVFHASRGNEETYSTVEDAATNLAARAKTEKERFHLIYNVDYLDFKNYNLVVDSSFCNYEVIAELIYREAKLFFEQNHCIDKILISPNSLYPTQSIRNINTDTLEKYIESYSGQLYYIDSLVYVAQYKGAFFIIDGHHKSMACAITSIPFITVEIIATEPDEIIASDITLEKYLKHIKLSDIYDYEDVCKFRFLEYPYFISN